MTLVNFEQISYIILVLSFLTLNKRMLAALMNDMYNNFLFKTYRVTRILSLIVASNKFLLLLYFRFPSRELHIESWQ